MMKLTYRTTTEAILPPPETQVNPSKIYAGKTTSDLQGLVQNFIRHASHSDRQLLKTVLLNWEFTHSYDKHESENYGDIPLAASMLQELGLIES